MNGKCNVVLASLTPRSPYRALVRITSGLEATITMRALLGEYRVL